MRFHSVIYKLRCFELTQTIASEYYPKQNMFKFNYQDCTLSEILDEDDVLQETKSQNRKLVDL